MSGFEVIIQPDEEEAEAAEVLVDGRIGGRPYRFLLDTGAAKTSVLFDEYTSTFAHTAQDASSGVFASDASDVISVPNIELGPIVRQDFAVVRTAEGAPHARSLIGMDLLKDFCCHFLFDENRVAVDAEGSPEDGPQDGYHDLYLDSRFHPYITLRYGPVRASAVWDTGSGITVADLSFIQAHPALFQAAGQSQGTDSTGANMETPMFVMAAATIGNQRFAPIRVAGVDLSRVNATLETPMDLILGYNLLRQANWVMDFPRRKWAISKPME